MSDIVNCFIEIYEIKKNGIVLSRNTQTTVYDGVCDFTLHRPVPGPDSLPSPWSLDPLLPVSPLLEPHLFLDNDFSTGND